jgi:hypothetical protein
VINLGADLDADLDGVEAASLRQRQTSAPSFGSRQAFSNREQHHGVRDSGSGEYLLANQLGFHIDMQLEEGVVEMLLPCGESGE